MTLVIGGWLVVDQCVRASHEGQMFAEQQLLAKQQQERNSAWPVTKSSTALIDKAGTNPITEERIAHRLEFLAMGENPTTTVVIAIPSWKSTFGLRCVPRDSLPRQRGLERHWCKWNDGLKTLPETT